MWLGVWCCCDHAMYTTLTGVEIELGCCGHNDVVVVTMMLLW